MKVLRHVARDRSVTYMVRISPKEAWALVRSMANQVLEGSPNAGRLETYTTEGEYFSVAVQDDKGGLLTLDDVKESWEAMTKEPKVLSVKRRKR